MSLNMARTIQTTARRRGRESSEESDDEEYDDTQAQNGTMGRSQGATQAGSSTQATGGLKEDALRVRGIQLARLALFTEYKRKPMNRRDLVANVIPDYPRAFNATVSAANRQLREIFGMELVEYRAKLRTEGGGEEIQDPGKGKGKAKEGEEEEASTSRVKGSATWGLRSTLRPELLALMNQPRPMPALTFDTDEYAEDPDVPDSGALLRWEKGDGGQIGHVALLGIRTIIFALVLCSGRVIQESHLYALLKRLNLYRDTPLPYISPDSRDQTPLTLEKYISELEKAKYLEKKVIPGAIGTEESATVEWRWGSREVEFTEAAAAQFIEDVFEAGEESDSDDGEGGGEGERRQRDREAERRKKIKLKKDIEQAAGSELVGEI